MSDIGGLQARVSRLEADVKDLERENRELRALLNRGRGAVWVLGGLAGLITFALTQWKSLSVFFK